VDTKKPYRGPTLVRWGSVRDLTRAAALLSAGGPSSVFTGTGGNGNGGNGNGGNGNGRR